MTGPLPIVAIHGAPRSGTTWLGQLFNSSPCVAYRYQPLFSYAFRGRIDAATGVRDLQRFFADLAASDDPFVLQAGSQALARNPPVFEKSTPTHLVYKEVRFHDLLPHLLATVPQLKAIGLVRDPRSVIASWSRAPREFDPAWSLTEEWRHARMKNAGLPENWFGFERWTELAGMFTRLEAACPDRFRLLRYEDLARAPAEQLRALFDFSGLTWSQQTQRFVEASTTTHDDDPYGVYKAGGTRDPSTTLDEGIRDRIESELSGTPLARFLGGTPAR